MIQCAMRAMEEVALSYMTVVKCWLVKVARRERAAVLSGGSSDSLFASTQGEVVELQQAICILAQCIAKARESSMKERQDLLRDAFELVRGCMESAQTKEGLLSVDDFTTNIHQTITRENTYECMNTYDDNDKSYIQSLLQVYFKCCLT